VIQIRPYRDEDRDATVRLWLASWRSTGLEVALKPSEAELYRAMSARIDEELTAGWLVRLASDEERLVGFLALKPAEGCLDQLFVLPEAQRTGVGSALLALARELAPEGLWLRTAEANRRARRFYEKHGFSKRETQLHPSLGHPTAIYRWP
jgi:GNAT superfamily N-acetyltransferase